MSDQQTLVLIKPDGLKKSLTGNILTRLSETKLMIIGAKVIQPNRQLVEEHYRHMKNQPFYEELVRYLMGELHTPRVMALVYHGEGAIQKVRSVCGATNPEEADPVSIRGAYGRITTKGLYENVIHASSNEPEAEREIKLWFKPEELVIEPYPTRAIEIAKQKLKVWS